MIDTDFVIATNPYPAESSTMISPSVFVTVIAAPNERHGSVSEQLFAVLASTPFGDTNVRCAEACAAAAGSARASAAAAWTKLRRRLRGRRRGIENLRRVGVPAPRGAVMRSRGRLRGHSSIALDDSGPHVRSACRLSPRHDSSLEFRR